MKKDKVPSAVIHRLPRYYRHLNDLYLADVECISSNVPGKSMGLTAPQIRQGLSCFDGFGQRGYGCNIENLRGGISDILGMNHGHNAVILGAGNLGRASTENPHSGRSGVTLSAVFDVASDVVGQRLSGAPVHHAGQLGKYPGQHPTSTEVLMVPWSVVSWIAGRLVVSGVKGIWDLTNIELTVDAPDIAIEDVHLADSLLALSYIVSEVP